MNKWTAKWELLSGRLEAKTLFVGSKKFDCEVLLGFELSTWEKKVCKTKKILWIFEKF